MEIIIQIAEDGLFAAIAAIGFAAISRPPRRAYIYCALIAAAGHSLRYVLTGQMHANMILSTFIAALLTGILSVAASRRAKFPAETCLFPALLPMIPGIYAYKAFGGLALSLLSESQSGFDHYFSLFAYNGMMCCSLLLCMVAGATLPIFFLKKISFQATR